MASPPLLNDGSTWQDDSSHVPTSRLPRVASKSSVGGKQHAQQRALYVQAKRLPRVGAMTGVSPETQAQLRYQPSTNGHAASDADLLAMDGPQASVVRWRTLLRQESAAVRETLRHQAAVEAAASRRRVRLEASSASRGGQAATAPPGQRGARSSLESSSTAATTLYSTSGSTSFALPARLRSPARNTARLSTAGSVRTARSTASALAAATSRDAASVAGGAGGGGGGGSGEHQLERQVDTAGLSDGAKAFLERMEATFAFGSQHVGRDESPRQRSNSRRHATRASGRQPLWRLRTALSPTQTRHHKYQFSFDRKEKQKAESDTRSFLSFLKRVALSNNDHKVVPCCVWHRVGGNKVAVAHPNCFALLSRAPRDYQSSWMKPSTPRYCSGPTRLLLPLQQPRRLTRQHHGYSRALGAATSTMVLTQGGEGAHHTITIARLQVCLTSGRGPGRQTHNGQRHEPQQPVTSDYHQATRSRTATMLTVKSTLLCCLQTSPCGVALPRECSMALVASSQQGCQEQPPLPVQGTPTHTHCQSLYRIAVARRSQTAM